MGVDVQPYSAPGITIAGTTVERVRAMADWVEVGTAPRLVTFTNVHMLTEAHQNSNFRKILERMDLNLPDEMPIVWMGKLKGQTVNRVCGPEFMPTFCAATAGKGFRHFFYGGGPGVAQSVATKLKEANPDIQIAGWYCPPYRNVSPEEDAAVVQEINESGVDVVWVCLGCPKQEIWMAEHRDRLKVRLILAVGMAFDTIAGTKRRAPAILRRCGLEWAYRFTSEPHRLWKRYLVSNLTF